MLPTTALYDALWADENHTEETKIVINNIEYTEDKLVSVSTRNAAFSGDELTVGGAVMGTINIELRVDGLTAEELSATIPRAAKIEPFVRLKGHLKNQEASAVVGVAVAGESIVGDFEGAGQEQTSEWLPQGVYWIAERSAVGWSSHLKIYGEDNMTWAEYDFPTVSHAWPATDITVVQDIATAMGVQIDSRTTDLMAGGYTIPKPEYYTMREVLGYIAAMYAGNFIFTKEGKLLLLALNSLPAAPTSEEEEP